MLFRILAASVLGLVTATAAAPACDEPRATTCCGYRKVIRSRTVLSYETRKEAYVKRVAE